MATKKPTKPAKPDKRSVDRLLVLADWLEKVVKPALNGAKFDMSQWGNKMPPANLKKAKECGFAACAVGWGLVCPALKKDGILEAAQPHITERGICVRDWNLMNFFGIEYRHLDHADAFWRLFMPSSYSRPTIDNVVRRLRKAHRLLSKRDDSDSAANAW